MKEITLIKNKITCEHTQNIYKLWKNKSELIDGFEFVKMHLFYKFKKKTQIKNSGIIYNSEETGKTMFPFLIYLPPLPAMC